MQKNDFITLITTAALVQFSTSDRISLLVCWPALRNQQADFSAVNSKQFTYAMLRVKAHYCQIWIQITVEPSVHTVILYVFVHIL